MNRKLKNSDILVIINPYSGRKKISKIEKELKQIGVRWVTTYSLTELKKTFESDVENYKVIVVAGGDGSVNEALKYMAIHNNKYFAVIPIGSGNGFARELGFNKSIRSIFKDIYNSEHINVDMLRLNNELFANVSGIGFESLVAHEFHNARGRGFKNYLISAFRSVLKYEPIECTVNTGTEKFKGRFFSVSIANTKQFGNNAFISPSSCPYDGKYEIVLTKDFPWYLYPSFVYKLFSGKLKNSTYLKYITCNGPTEIISDFNLYHLDGDPKKFNEKIKIEIDKIKLKVIKTGS